MRAAGHVAARVTEVNGGRSPPDLLRCSDRAYRHSMAIVTAWAAARPKRSMMTSMNAPSEWRPFLARVSLRYAPCPPVPLICDPTPSNEALSLKIVFVLRAGKGVVAVFL